MKTKSSTIFYNDQVKICKKYLTPEQFGRLIIALFEIDEGKEPDVDTDILMPFEFMALQKRLDVEKYEKKCAKNRENGRKGGRPKNPPKPNGFFENPNDNDNDNDNDNENENENENDNENESTPSSSVPDYSSLILSNSVLSHLNETTGSKYEVDEEICGRISQLVSDGYGEEDFRRVIDSKAAEWLNDPKMRRYLRPSTLFGPKFSDYAAAPPAIEVVEREQLITDRNGLISERDQLATRYQAIDDRMRDLETSGIDTEQNWNEWKDLDTERSAVGKSIEGLNKRISALTGAY